MKSNDSHPTAKFVSGLLLAVLLAHGAYAGPGPTFWQNVGKNKSAATVQPTTSSPKAGVVCTTSEVVVIKEAKKAEPSSGGTQAEVVTATKRVCYSCGGTTTQMRAPHNGKGPMTRVEVPNAHDCGPSCAWK